MNPSIVSVRFGDKFSIITCFESSYFRRGHGRRERAGSVAIYEFVISSKHSIKLFKPTITIDSSLNSILTSELVNRTVKRWRPTGIWNVKDLIWPQFKIISYFCYPLEFLSSISRSPFMKLDDK